ncbi:MAG: hypothetical protein LBL90_03810 [Prevotellaceae bacterium]|jgi:hypothetical protein|nr:hypothetical protein [Prevotellaceae bacterium]
MSDGLYPQRIVAFKHNVVNYKRQQNFFMQILIMFFIQIIDKLLYKSIMFKLNLYSLSVILKSICFMVPLAIFTCAKGVAMLLAWLMSIPPSVPLTSKWLLSKSTGYVNLSSL